MFTNLANYGALTYSTCTELEQFEHPIWVALICANLGQLKGICLYPMSNERMELVRFGTNLYWLVVWNMFFFHFIYGMSSFPLTNSYFSRWLLHHQAVWEQPKNAFNATGKISFSKNLDLGESIPITSCNQLKLVGGLEHLDYFFPFSWECHHPNSRSHIFRGIGIPPTRKRADWNPTTMNPVGLVVLIEWLNPSEKSCSQ